MKTIITDSRGGIIAKSNILKFSKKNEGNNKVLKRSNDNLIDIGNSLKKEKDPKFLNEYLYEILCNLYLEEKDYMKKRKKMNKIKKQEKIMKMKMKKKKRNKK